MAFYINKYCPIMPRHCNTISKMILATNKPPARFFYQALVKYLVKTILGNFWSNLSPKVKISRGCIFSRVQPFYERAVSDLDRSMHRSRSMSRLLTAHSWKGRSQLKIRPLVCFPLPNIYILAKHFWERPESTRGCLLYTSPSPRD